VAEKVKEKSKRAPKKTPRKATPQESPPGPELVIITGLSGSGKASALKAFEDLGYYCVDNLPVDLIPRFAELAVQSAEIRRTALVVDVREGPKLERLPAIVKSVKRMIPTMVIFLESHRRLAAPPLQRDAPPAPFWRRHAGAFLTRCRTPSPETHSRDRRLGGRHFEVQRP